MGLTKKIKLAVTGIRGIPATWGGAEHHCEEIYSRLASMGYEIVIYSRKKYIPQDIRFYKGIRIKRLPTINSKYTEALLHTFISVFDICLNNPDIIHLHSQGPAVFSFLPRIFRPKMKVFFTCHGRDWERKKWPKWASILIKFGEIISAVFSHYKITVSKELENYYIKTYRVNAFYIPNGINSPELKSIQPIRGFNLQYKKFFLFVGRIVAEKRLEDIIKAFIMKNRNFKLAIVGDSADAKVYMNHLLNLSKGSANIHFLGYQYGEMLQSLYFNAKAFITASELEGLPLTLLEAQISGIPCIASNIEPHKEILGESDPFLFPVGDINALSEKMALMEKLSDDEIDTMCKNNVNKIKERFNWDKAAIKLDELYRKSLI